MIQDLNSKTKEITITLAIILVGVFGFLYLQNRNKKFIDKNGIYLKCIIYNIEGHKGGRIVTIEYTYKKIKYRERSYTSLGNDAIGKQYFVKIIPEHPSSHLLLEESAVPECLIDSASHEAGWAKIPVCQ